MPERGTHGGTTRSGGPRRSSAFCAWKGGRYGHGQLLLLPDQDVMVIVTEQGELALVRADSSEFTEIARVPALESKTWNHPALVDDVLLVRNGEEMVAFRLALETT